MGQPSTKLVQGLKIKNREAEAVEEYLTVEAPLQVSINGRSFMVTMRTPGHDLLLVKGLLFTEEVVTMEGLNFKYILEDDPEQEGGALMNVTIPDVYLCPNIFEKRSLLSYSSCGICGKKEMKDVLIEGDRLKPRRPLAMYQLPSMAQTMKDHQTAFQQTGGCHAAAIFTMDGELIAIHEDIGRHNAVDKVIGHLIDEDRYPEAGILHVSGRISYEIVGKAYRAGIPFLIAVSAASSMAVKMGDRMGMTLIGFSREGRATVYSHPEQVELDAQQG